MLKRGEGGTCARDFDRLARKDIERWAGNDVK
jgi:hypothetical protein